MASKLILVENFHFIRSDPGPDRRPLCPICLSSKRELRLSIREIQDGFQMLDLFNPENSQAPTKEIFYCGRCRKLIPTEKGMTPRSVISRAREVIDKKK